MYLIKNTHFFPVMRAQCFIWPSWPFSSRSSAQQGILSVKCNWPDSYMPPLPCMCLTALPNWLPPSLLLKAQSVSWHVCIFHYFQFNTKPQRKEELAVGEERRREEEQDERKEKSERTKNTHLHPPPSTPPSHRKGGKNARTPVGIASTTQA